MDDQPQKPAPPNNPKAICLGRFLGIDLQANRCQEWMFECNYTLEKAGEEEISANFDRECELIPTPSAGQAWADRYYKLKDVDTSDLDACIEARDRMLAEWQIA